MQIGYPRLPYIMLRLLQLRAVLHVLASAGPSLLHAANSKLQQLNSTLSLIAATRIMAYSAHVHLESIRTCVPQVSLETSSPAIPCSSKGFGSNRMHSSCRIMSYSGYLTRAACRGSSTMVRRRVRRAKGAKRFQKAAAYSWKLTSHLHAFAKQAKPVFGLGA